MRIRALPLLLALVAAACSGSSDDASGATSSTASSANPPLETTTTTTAPPTTTSTSTTTSSTLPPIVAPLTGLPGGNPDQQVLIAKLSNATKGRPQIGINEADMVMEVLVEGGIGRWLAVFQTSYPQTVGPLRSLREVDPKLIGPFDSRLLSSGGQFTVRREVGKVAVDESDGRIPGYRREPDRAFVYSLVYDVENLPELDWEGPVQPVIEFDAMAPSGGDEAGQIEVIMSRLNTVSWEFKDGVYLRSQDGADSLDADGDRITADNVVVVFVEALRTGRADAAGSPVPDYEVTGTGDTVVLRNGQAYEGTWERETEEDFFTLFDGAGDPLAMSPGRTWVHITPVSGVASWE